MLSASACLSMDLIMLLHCTQKVACHPSSHDTILWLPTVSFAAVSRCGVAELRFVETLRGVTTDLWEPRDPWELFDGAN